MSGYLEVLSISSTLNKTLVPADADPSLLLCGCVLLWVMCTVFFDLVRR